MNKNKNNDKWHAGEKMREILFRGKRVDNGEWIKGIPVESVVDGGIKMFIITHAKWDSDDNSIDFFETEVDEIIPSTVGQFTGLTDKNEVKIFEGDILKVERTAVVKYNEIKAAFVAEAYDDEEEYLGEAFDEELEVIGNIHDTPELLEGSNEQRLDRQPKQHI